MSHASRKLMLLMFKIWFPKIAVKNTSSSLLIRLSRAMMIFHAVQHLIALWFLSFRKGMILNMIVFNVQNLIVLTVDLYFTRTKLVKNTAYRSILRRLRKLSRNSLLGVNSKCAVADFG